MVEERMLIKHSSATVKMGANTNVSHKAKTRAILKLEEMQKENDSDSPVLAPLNWHVVMFGSTLY